MEGLGEICVKDRVGWGLVNEGQCGFDALDSSKKAGANIHRVRHKMPPAIPVTLHFKIDRVLEMTEIFCDIADAARAIELRASL